MLSVSDTNSGLTDPVAKNDARAAELRCKISKSLSGIYVIVGPGHTQGRDVLEVARSALGGGACAIQLRDKQSTADSVRRWADKLRRLCSDAGALLIINDDPSVARESHADGVHVGQTDASISLCRTVLLNHQITGKSNANEMEAHQSMREGADYIAVGSIFPTETKFDTRPAGLVVLRRVVATKTVPVVAIGGINDRNIGEVAEAGADAVCVASAVAEADDPEAATHQLLKVFRAANR